MKKLFSMLAFIFVFSISYGQSNPLTIMNNTPFGLTVTVIAGDPATCGGIQSTVVTIPSGTTLMVPPFVPGPPMEWLLVCNNSSGTCDTYYNTLVPNTCLGSMPGAPPSTIFSGTWHAPHILELR